jgi:plasmid stabilization system protein ParE
MTQLVVTADAAADTNDILSYLVQEAGSQVAEKYAGQFRVTIERLLRWPESGAPRPHLGEDVRIAVVSPYVLIYQYSRGDDTLVVLRMLHGRRNITDRLLRRR